MEARLPSIRTAVVAVSVASALYSIWYLRRLATSVTSTSLKLSPGIMSEHRLPEEVKAHPQDWIAYQEHTTKTLPASSLPAVEDLGVIYLRHSMQAFAKLPQASIMYLMIKDPHARSTFGKKYLSTCDFEVGDVVCGVYKVSRHEFSEIQLDVHPPPGWTGPTVKGNIINGFRKDSIGSVVFSNDVYMWRKPNEPKLLLESAGGRFFHRLTAAYVVNAGINGLLKE
jgi:hypothetical protein